MQRVPSRFRDVKKENDGVSFVFLGEKFKLVGDLELVSDRYYYNLVQVNGRKPGCLSFETLETIKRYMQSIVRQLRSTYSPSLTADFDDVVVTIDQNENDEIILKALCVCMS